jgi:hypothetical protein
VRIKKKDLEGAAISLNKIVKILENTGIKSAKFRSF